MNSRFETDDDLPDTPELPIRLIAGEVPDLPARLGMPIDEPRATDGQGAPRHRHDRWRFPTLSFNRLLPLLPAAIVGLAALAGLISPLFSLIIIGATIAITIFATTPQQSLALFVTFCALAVDNPRASPANGYWSPPWIFIGSAFYKNIDPLPLCLLDILAGFCLLRGIRHIRLDSKLRIQRERLVIRVLTIAFCSILVGFTLGVLRGGDLKQAVYQARVFLWIPAFALGIIPIADMAFLRRLKTVVIAACCVKASTGLWVAATIHPSSTRRPMEYVTTHGDSVTYTMVVCVILAAWIARVDRRLRKYHAVGMFMALVGLYTNQRRIAFVSIAFGIGIMYFDAAPDRRRAINLSARRFVAPALIYFAVAFTGISHNAIFRPALSLRSVVIQDDRSSSTRDIENFNLYFTYRSNPLLGVGFGHEYIEYSVGDYIGDVFPQYRYLPHNSMLGLFAYGGFLVAGGFYVMFPAMLYLGLRSTKRRYSPERWAMSMFGAGGIAAVLIQGFGDVGFHDQVIGLLGGIAIGVCGALYCLPDVPREAAPVDAHAAKRLQPA